MKIFLINHSSFFFYAGLCGPHLKLHCKKHSDRVTLVGNLNDFQNIKNGGCSVWFSFFFSFFLEPGLDKIIHILNYLLFLNSNYVILYWTVVTSVLNHVII